MTRVEIFVTLFVMLAMCALVAESRGFGKKGALAARGPRRHAVSGNGRQGILERGAVKNGRDKSGVFSFFFDIIGKVLEAVGIKDKEEPEESEEVEEPSAEETTTPEVEEEGTTETPETPGTPGTTPTAGTPTTTNTG